MKKLKLIFVCVLFTQILFAQIKVQDDGKVGVGVSASTNLLSKFSIGTAGDASSLAYIGASNTYGLNILNGGPGGKTALYARASACGSGTAIGVLGSGNYNSSNCIVTGIGVRGIAGSNQMSYAIGVSGLLNANGGAGVFGKIGTSETTFTGAYAAYFDGDAMVANGTLTATVVAPSDSRLKKNVLDLDYQQTLAKLMQMRPVEYKMQQVMEQFDSINERGDTVSYRLPRYDETTPFFQKTHYGLIAQEVKEIFPDLVYEGSDGYLGIDYTSLVPLLLKLVQQQQTEIESMKQQRNNAPARNESSVSRNAELFQNVPNPFNENSEIAFYLPENVKSAMLCVYDMNGKQLSQTIIKERGNSTFVINGRSYGAGMYLYSLIADSQVVDTKRMILTK